MLDGIDDKSIDLEKYVSTSQVRIFLVACDGSMPRRPKSVAGGEKKRTCDVLSLDLLRKGRETTGQARDEGRHWPMRFENFVNNF